MNLLIKLLLLIVFLSIPTVTFADADKIFSENRKSTVVVTAYNKKGQPLTEGTGFIVGPEGAVITNYHVIGIAKDIKVRADGKVLDVEGVTYADKENDLVVLKVKGRDMRAVRPGDFHKMTLGDKVYVISNTEDSGNIIHEGTFRKIRGTSRGNEIIEITAPVTYGSSGSPVFNSRGEVIGIVTSLLKRSDKIILAVPLDRIREKMKGMKIITSMEKLIRDYRRSAEYWFYLGYFLSETGAYHDAVDVLREAIRLRPGYSDAYYSLGITYEKTGNDKEAVRAFKQAVKTKTDFADAHFSLGLTYGRLGMYREARDILKQAVQIEPDFAEAHYNFGIVCLLLKDRASALERYRILKAIDTDLAGKLLRLINK